MNSTSAGSSRAASAVDGSKLGSQGWPEPSPDWSDRQVDHWAWKLHVYGFASIFLIFAVDAIFVLIRDWKPRRKLHIRFLNLELIFFSSVRVLVLLFDPYGSADYSKASNAFTLVLWGLATASLISAFGILLLILLDTTQTSLGPQKLQRLSVLLSITALNCVLFIVAHAAAFFVEDTKAVIFACRLLFALWGFGFCFGYAITCSRIWRNVKASRLSTLNDSGFVQETARLRKISCLMCLASVVGAAMFSLSLYVAFYELRVVGAGSQSSVVDFWPWYTIETALRFLELMVMFLIFGIAIKAKVGSTRRVAERSGHAIPMQTFAHTSISTTQ